MAQVAATRTAVVSRTVSRLAVRRESRRYTVPCARGAPPRSAPEMYHARKIGSCQPKTVVSDSVVVPTA